MKKRIVCVLLTLIMLLSLVPMGASAATHTTSESAITVLKQMTALKTNCYHFAGTEFRTGYGTVCEEKHVFGTDGMPKAKPAEYTDENGKPAYKEYHTITELKADQILRKALLALDEKVNTFASANSLSLTQYQHDALVVFSYDAGTGWMSGSGALKSAIIKGCTATELLNAMNLWTGNASNGNTASLERRKVEVNMYMNGIYSNAISSAYGYVVYKANGGSMPQADYNDSTKYTFYYDTNTTMDHPVVPTKNGAIFLGWYADVNGTDTSKAQWAPKLNSVMNTHTLTALWQEGTTLATSARIVGYKLTASQLAEQYVYNGSDGKVNETLTKKLEEEFYYNDAVAVDRDFIDSKGDRWSRMAGTDGWLKVGTHSNDSYSDSYGTVIATATVTVNGYLNVRADAGTDNKIVGSLAKNDTVDIYEIKTVNGQQWGRSKHGWLCLTYTRLLLKNNVTISDAGLKAYAFTGKLKGSTPVKVHVEAGDNTNYVKYPVYPMVKNDESPVDTDLSIPADTAVTMTNLFMVNGELWTKATWTQKENKWTEVNGEKVYDFHYVTRSGWVKFNAINMDPATFTVAADSVNVRDNWGDAANQIFTLNKGVEIKVIDIRLVNESLWGHFTAKKVVQTGTEQLEGYVNLASKYFSRVGAPTVENTSTATGKIATVINTDSLKVRATGATYGTQIGSLSRGTTVAVWEVNEDDWYKVDSNQNGVFDYEDDGWCSGSYLDVRAGNVGGTTTVTGSNGTQYQTDGTGKGIVANTYSGVNVRTGPGTGYAANGKLLTGTVVDILETANGGKWGRVAQGWISMDYVTMISYNEVVNNTTNGGTTVDSFDKAEKTTTTAVYTGTLSAGVNVYRTADAKDSEKIRTTSTAENITIYELATVTKTVTSQEEEIAGGKTQVTTTTETSHWARINDGWVQNPDTAITLNALDEKVHTQTGAAKLKVRETYSDADGVAVIDVLVQGDQVKVTALKIVKDKVWGRVDTAEGTGWIRLDYMSEGEVYVKKPAAQNNTTNNNVLNNLGQTSSTGGYVNNTSGYRYTGKVIRANELSVRATPSTAASKTTSLKNGAALVIYETTIAENMAWGRCDAGWVYLYYVDLTPAVNGAVDARVVYNENTIIYSDVNGNAVAGTYAKMSVIDIYEVVGKMARTDLGWVNTDNLL